MNLRQMGTNSIRGRLKGLQLLIVATLAAGCADLRDIMSLQQGLAKEFNEAGINVNLNNGKYLTVTFSNSSATDLPDAERAAFARRVAEYVRDHYPHYSSLESIGIGFASVTKTGPVTFTNTTVPYRYTPQDLGPPKVTSNKTIT